jgi:formylglycine-generating enzyme required for sulfatase activity
MAIQPTSPEHLVNRITLLIDRWWRRAKYHWLNSNLLTDVAIAIVFFAVVFFTAKVLPKESSQLNSGGGVVLAIFASLPPLLMVGGFWYVRRYLKGEAAYENLRAAKRPILLGLFERLLRFPCWAVVLFALFTGIALAAWGCGGWGPAVQTSMMQVTAPLPPVATALNRVFGQEAAPWPGWVDFVLSLVYSVVVFALVAAWFERSKQRQNYVASLFTEEDRPSTPYGFRFGQSPEYLQPEPHEQVLLMQGGRIGDACLPYLRMELSGPEWTTEPVMTDRCRGAVAVLERVFGVNERKEFDPKRGEAAWQTEPLASTFIADWLLVHLGRLVDQDCSLPDSAFDHRLGEAVLAVAAVLASSQSLPCRPTPTSRGAFHDSEKVGKLRAHLRHLFSRSPKRPALLIAACDAAERLGTPEDLRLLDEQTRRLDVQAGFTVPQTDRILQTRDRVLSREPLRRALMERLIKRIEGLGMERVPGPVENPLLFRRSSDGGVMALIVAGSFCRGDDNVEETSPRRRVHLGSYLIDIKPVSQDSFKRWVETQGSVLRVERGFFPVQGLPDDVPQNRQYASHVTWFAAQAYAQWVVTGGHLPTEAQWEKSARGTDDDRRYPSGNTWVDDPESPFGIRLCHLLEWTHDAFDRLAYRRSPVVFDPRMESAANLGDEAMRVIRGRTQASSVGSYSLANRLGMEPVTGAFTAPVGFRVVVDLEQEPQA